MASLIILLFALLAGEQLIFTRGETHQLYLLECVNNKNPLDDHTRQLCADQFETSTSPPPPPGNTFPSPGSGAFDLKNRGVGHLTNTITAGCRECENGIFVVTRAASDVKMWLDIGGKDICFVTGSGKVGWRNKRTLLTVSVMNISL